DRHYLYRVARLTRALGQRFGILDPAKRLVLVTGHRRESFGRGFEGICAWLRRIAERADVEIVYPMHLNPAVQRPVRRALTGLTNMHLIEPLGYEAFVYLKMRSEMILADSCGRREEETEHVKRC